MTSAQFKIGTLIILGALLVFFWRAKADLKSRYRYDKISMMARFVAKEYCSCRYVTLRTEEACREFTNVSLPILGVRVHTNWIIAVTEPKHSPDPSTSNLVQSTAFWGLLKARADFAPDRGCRLLP